MKLIRSLLFGICAIASSTLLAQERPLPGDQSVWTLTEYPDHIPRMVGTKTGTAFTIGYMKGLIERVIAEG